MNIIHGFRKKYIYKFLKRYFESVERVNAMPSDTGIQIFLLKRDRSPQIRCYYYQTTRANSPTVKKMAGRVSFFDKVGLFVD